MHDTPPRSTGAVASPSPQAVQMLTALLTQGQFARCEEQARAMIAQFADHAFGWSVLGACLAQTGRFGDAVAPMQKAASLQPANAGLAYNLGNILSRLSRFGEAEACFRRVLALKPDDAAAHNNLGNALDSLGRPSEAEACYRSALALKPDFALAHNNLGSTLIAMGRLNEAEACLRRALALQPDYVQAHGNLGTVLNRLGRPSEAEACFRRVLALKPDDVVAHNNLGNTLGNLGRASEAEACYRSALALKPDYIQAHNNLGINLTNAGRFAEAEACFRRALALKPDYTQAHSGLLFSLNYRNDAASVALDEARRYGQCVNGLASRVYTDWSCETGPRRLRVGFVSGDFRDHAVSYFLESLLSEINPARIETITYPTQPNEDHVSQRLRALFAAWRPIAGLTDAAAAARIHADGVHVLLDLSGHTAHNRLPVFAYRPAPVQASWLGYFATTGVVAMDYLIADPWTLPESEEVNFTEKIWRLPETRLCFTPPDAVVQVSPLPALTNGYITFGCFNDLAKINDGVVALWSRVLTAVPGSRLFLKAKQLQEASVRQRIVERFAAHGIGADRLIPEPPAPRAEYLAAYQRVDIALDPFPYPGGTTSAESLWMGVPVLTLAGERFLSRQGVGLLMNTGLPEWVASGPDDYLARAVAHANDLRGLAALRAVLRDRFLASPVCDAKRFARHFEQALEGMWRDRAG
ncbi:MAG: O-linked N-acetylglucosamine transferase family protein [Sulfuricaulis sp.]